MGVAVFRREAFPRQKSERRGVRLHLYAVPQSRPFTVAGARPRA